MCGLGVEKSSCSGSGFWQEFSGSHVKQYGCEVLGLEGCRIYSSESMYSLGMASSRRRAHRHIGYSPLAYWFLVGDEGTDPYLILTPMYTEFNRRTSKLRVFLTSWCASPFWQTLSVGTDILAGCTMWSSFWGSPVSCGPEDYSGYPEEEGRTVRDLLSGPHTQV